MTALLILWSHAVAALLLGVLAAVAARPGQPRKIFVLPLGATAVAALAVPGLGVGDVGAVLAGALADLAWIGALTALARRHRAAPRAMAAVAASVGVAALCSVALATIATLPAARGADAAVFSAMQALRMVAAAGGLLIVHQAATAAARRGDHGLVAGLFALAILWAGQLAAALAAWAAGGWAPSLVAARGILLLGVAVVIGAALTHRRETPLALSRQGMARLAGGAALAAYLLLLGVASSRAAMLGPYARIAQVAVVVGGGAALMALVATPWLRAWTRVTIAKHLFGHRYDYRAEWQRFTAALAGHEPIAERVVRALAGFTDSPGGLLLAREGEALVVEAAWRWTGADWDGEGSGALAATLARGWVIELDQLRAGDGEARAAVPPGLLTDGDAWAIVPLIHDGQLVAGLVLARPPVARALDWEDFDLLRVAGRQAASHLAEERARAALAEARRFDEFHRRFAFIMHDLKNLVSQMTLTASNARRHADNPDFRADMVATLGDCAERMTQLIGRLQSHGERPAEAAEAVDLTAVAARVARRFPHHPVTVAGQAVATAQPQRLEQLLAHLIQNAIEASAAGDPVAVTIAGEGARASVAVRDRGCGMTAAFVRDELFRPFASSKPGGFGLGAHEARALALAMGGTLDVSSRTGEGTCFTLRLPAANTLEEAA